MKKRESRNAVELIYFETRINKFLADVVAGVQN
jgi:hypothetical protein